MNTTKRSFLTSLVSLVLCFTMLLGTTFAWFSDVVTSSGNVIQSGNLDAEMYWSDKYLAADAIGWKQVKENKPIFTYDKWEPGYTEIKYIKVANEGSLNLKWQLTIEAEGEVTNLSDVIDVYYVNPVTAKLESLDGLQSEGKLTNVLANKTAEAGSLTSGTSTVLAIAFHMDELAGNDYQGKKLCEDGFSVKLVATQATGESDSFDDQYDAEAQWPGDLVIGNTASAPAENVNGVLGADASMTSADGKISANVPAGTKLEAGANKLTLNVANMDKSKANITLDENEAALSIDVHILGVAKDNETVMEIDVKELLPVGLNMGNYRFYHVENGNTDEMTLLEDGATPVHNNYDYDPATGDVVLYLKSFSEVALVANNENAWKGEVNHSWYDASKIELTIANADQLWSFSQIVGGMAEGIEQDSFKGKTVKLIADINLGDDEEHNNSNIIFYPIGYNSSDGKYEKTSVAINSSLKTFEGIFDGNGNTISNFYHNTWEMKGDHNWYDATLQYYRDGMGLFGRVYGGTVKNLTVKNFSSDGEIATTGVIAAYADGATFENIAIFNCNPRVYNIGNGGIVGCVGWYAKEAGLTTSFKNITVDNSNKISALWGSYDVACGGIVGQYYPTSGQSSAGTPKNAGIDFVNCHVSAIMDVYNDVCGNYQYYAYRYAGMLIGSIRENTTNEDGKTIPDMTGISASGCTVNYGDWNDYYYCEFEKNGHPSYSGPNDYKFSRVPHSELDFDDANGNGLVDADERASVRGCNHDHTDAEDNQAIYLPFYQLFTGYGWGVSSIGLKEYSGIVTDLGITEGNQQESIVKFEKAENATTTYKAGQTITLAELFKEIGNIKVPVVDSSVNVTVSPATDNDTVSATFKQNILDWTQGTITFADNCNGSAKIVITDYFYCTATVIYLDESKTTPKFTANNVGDQYAYTQIALGTIFSAKDGVTLGDVTVSITPPNCDSFDINGADWAVKTIDLTKNGTWTVAIKDNDKYCSVTETTFNVNSVNKFINKFDKNFLYRVGNENDFAIGYIFGENNTNYPLNLSNVNVIIEKVKGDVSSTFTANTSDWANGKLKFTGTGVVKVTISAEGANAVVLNLEVVDATNSTSAVGTTTGGNFVLLCDVNTSSFQYLWDCKLYGNGFIYSLKGAPTKYSSGHGHGVLITKNATLDNLVIVGDEYTGYGTFNDDDYYTSAIDVTADTIIQNCYISGCSAPVRARSNVTIVNSTLYGGAVANLIIQSGTVTLTDVTTANYDDGRTLVGMGIVIHSDASENAKLVLNGTLTQYNFMSESKVPNNSYAKNLHTAMFDSSCSQYHFGTSPNRYVNTGIISMTSTFTREDIEDNANTGYTGNVVTISGVEGTGYVFTQPNTNGSVNNNCPNYVATTQGAVVPPSDFDYINKNYIPKTEGSNDYCYEENNIVYISMDAGDTFDWDTSILIVSKFGNNLEYNVTMNSIDYSGKKIAFNEAGNYTVVYTFIDEVNYAIDENGEVITYSVTYVKSLNIVVSVIKETTKHAEFTFGNNQTVEMITINNQTYLSATNKQVDTTSWGCITVNGTTIYYPIVAAEIVKTKDKTIFADAEVQAYFPVFDGTISVIDYQNGGTGDPVYYNSKTQTMPTNLSVIKGLYQAVEKSTEWYKSTNDSNLSDYSGQGAAKIFCYASSNTTSSTPTLRNNKLCFYSESNLPATRKAYFTIVQYCYTDNAGRTYYYYVGYSMEDSTQYNQSSSGGTCIAEGSMITLADGSKKAVEDLRKGDVVMAFDHITGKVVYRTINIVGKTYADSYYRNIFIFDDGTELNAINEHGIYDLDLNMYVNIGELNYHEYIGHRFVSIDACGNMGVKRLVDVVTTIESGYKYDIVTNETLNYVVEDTLSVSHELVTIMNSFAFGDNMVYDAEAMNADIAEYGLYTYEDFAQYCEREVFEQYNMAMMKVGVGKGLYTYEHLVYLLTEIALNDDVQITD